MPSPAELPGAILAGGLATRLKPITETLPKLLVDVAGEPFFTHQIRLLKKSGLRRLVLCVGYLGEKIVERYGDGSRWGVEIAYSFDGPKLLGTGGALIKALPALGDAFYVLYGDSYLPIDYLAVGRAFLASGKLGMMTVFENSGRFDSSNVWFEAGAIRAYDKKNRLPAMRHIDYGLGVLHAAALARVPDGTSWDLAALYQELLEAGELAAFEAPHRFYEIGSFSGVEELCSYLSQGRESA